jgi:DNA-binding response OmpR family regulator
MDRPRPRILLVDDSATQLEALRLLLESESFDVTTAASGEDALAVFESRSFDLILSDVVMPGMSGYEVCREIKRRADDAAPPSVVLLTSLADPTDIVRGLECGADNYITKPYDPEQLVARLHRVLENRRLRAGIPSSERVPIRFRGEEFEISSGREQILELLLSSFEELVHTNEALQESKRALADAHARELQREKEARQEAERAAFRSELVARASGVLSSAQNESEAFGGLASIMTADLADLCVIHTAPNGSPARVFARARPSEADGTATISLDAESWGEVLQGDRADIVSDLPEELRSRLAGRAGDELLPLTMRVS